MIKEYDESTVGLEPLVLYQRDGIKPNQVERTPAPKPPKRPKMPKTPHTPYGTISGSRLNLQSHTYTAGNRTPGGGFREVRL